MSENEKNSNPSRRTFLKAMGLGSAGGALVLSGCGDTDLINEVDLEVRKEHVLPNVDPQDFVVPGNEIYYASICQQCPAGCGTHARVREGRVLKLEGNPQSAINVGRLCPMGQAGLHGHYNPDRLHKPMARKNGKLVEVSWDDANKALTKHLGTPNKKLAWIGGVESGHDAVLIREYMDAIGSKNWVNFDPMVPEVGLSAQEKVYGERLPIFDLAKADLIVSFGADFLGTWMSPVHFASQYAEFRKPSRGTLVQIESKMTLTGSNADRWIAIRPGTEGHLALAIASLLASDPHYAARIPNEMSKALKQINIAEFANITDVPEAQIRKIHHHLTTRTPSLVLSGWSAENGEQGEQAALAAHLLNVMLGNVGKTVLPRAQMPFPDLGARSGGWAKLSRVIQDLHRGKIDTVVVHGTNPLYHAPAFMEAKKAFAKAGFRVAFSMFPDETTLACDLVIPIHSSLEEWGSSYPLYPAKDGVLGLRQPTMYPVFGKDSTKAFGEVMLTLIKGVNPSFKHWGDYHAYLIDALSSMKGKMATMPKPQVDGETDQEALVQTMLSDGQVQFKTTANTLRASAILPKLRVPTSPGGKYPYTLIPSPRLGLWDGRHANLPWLQELPDQLSAVVWDSWLEIHPKTAAKLGIKTGDKIKVSSEAGDIIAKSLIVDAVVIASIHPEAIAIPLGQGHTEYGRYAKGIGVNPFELLNPTYDDDTGELSVAATRIQIEKIADYGKITTLATGDLVQESHTFHQAGRKLVKTISAEDFNRTEKEV
ncbi:MAG: molybdopterin-dependent oxidoreductase [Mariprofundales bacterium]|nr:molybdopterin-dependent oxidoreductase [Mariprofundales bacterium]